LNSFFLVRIGRQNEIESKRRYTAVQNERNERAFEEEKEKKLGYGSYIITYRHFLTHGAQVKLYATAQDK